MLKKLNAKAEELIEEIEEMEKMEDPPEDAAAQLAAVKAKLAEVMAQIEALTSAASAAGEAKAAMAKVSLPASAPRVPVVEDKTTLAKAEMIAFHKAWTGQPMGDTESRLVLRPGKGLAAPTALKCAMFGRRISEQMGWAKKLNPVEDSSLIPNRYDPQLSYIEGEASGILDYCRVVPAPEGNLQVTRLDRTNSPAEWGVVASWLVTGSTKPETEPVFERESISCGELAAYTAVADRLFTRSSWDLMRELSRMFTGELRHLIDIAIMQGTGVNQPTGIIGYAGVDLQTRETANQVEYLDLVNLKYGINPRALAGSVWILQHDVMAYLEGTLATVDGRPLFAATVASGPVDRLLGFPYVVTVDCNAALGAEGDVVFGNFSHYTIAMEDDVVFATDDGKGAGFTSNTTYVKAYASVGGLPLEPDAFSVLDNEVSP